MDYCNIIKGRLTQLGILFRISTTMARLTKEQIQFYKNNGYIKLSGIFSDKEMDIISKEYDRIFRLKNNPGMEAAWVGNDMKKLANYSDYTVQSVHNLQFHSAIFAQVLHNNKLLDALEDIMGPDILLHHTKAHNKPPGRGAPYLMHQDYHYFPFKKNSMLAVFLHVDDSSPENGGLCVYPGTHKLGPLKDFGLTDEKGDTYHYCDPEKYPVEKAEPVKAKKGDIVIFSYLLLHGSYRNLSDRDRRMFLIQLMSADDEPIEEVHKSPGQGWVLRGKNDNRKAHMSERFLH